MKRLERIKQRLGSITSGVWEWDGYSQIICEPGKGSPFDWTKPDDDYEHGLMTIASIPNKPGVHGDLLQHPQLKANAMFIEEAPKNIKYLLDIAERSKELIEHIRNRHEDFCPHWEGEVDELYKLLKE